MATDPAERLTPSHRFAMANAAANAELEGPLGADVEPGDLAPSPFGGTLGGG